MGREDAEGRGLQGIGVAGEIGKINCPKGCSNRVSAELVHGFEKVILQNGLRGKKAV